MYGKPMRTRLTGPEDQGLGLGTGSLTGFDLHRFGEEVARELGIDLAAVDERTVRSYEQQSHSRRSR